MAEAEWYYLDGGEQVGPLSSSVLRQRALAGLLQPTDLIWRTGLADWVPASRAKGLFSSGSISPHDVVPPPPAQSYGTTHAPQDDAHAAGLVAYAGFWKRFAAYAIDWIITFVGGFVVGFVIGFTMALGGAHPDEIRGVSILVGLVMTWLYFAVMENSRYQATFGKMALGIEVTDLLGRRVGFGKATGRFFGKVISALMLCIGFIMIAFTETKQGLHDMMGSCLVVSKRR